MTGVGKLDAGLRRRGPARRVVLVIAIVAALTLLCCGGTVSAILLGGFGDGDDNSVNAAFGCGKGGPVDPDSKLPRISPYGAAQVRNAAIIIKVGADLDVPPRGWVIAVATAMQESRLTNLGHLGTRNDHDSLGLFQQRPSAGWGTPAQVRDPVYAATKFYQKLKEVTGWEKMALTDAAQKVQISAYPNAYAKHERLATHIVNLLADGAARAVGESVTAVCAVAGQIAASGWTVPIPGSVGSAFRSSSRPDHHGVDIAAARYTKIWAATSGVVTTAACDIDRSKRYTCNNDGYPGKGGCGWYVEILHASNVMTRYCHMVERPSVRVGQSVTAGQVIGRIGTSGDSSGPHLHFEVHLNNDGSSAGAVNPVQFMADQGAPLGGAA
ncbi:MAG TPA: M23 family metallopeptidase [Catenuloplanes sp.]|jgi:murein DD-endopeptidase MepM/ murein hydrolase activator NlpD